MSENHEKKNSQSFLNDNQTKKLEGSVLSFPRRSPFGNPKYRGNADGGILLNLIRHYSASRVGDPMEGGGTSRDVCKELGIEYWGGDLRNGFDATKDTLPGEFDLVYVHPPYWDIIKYSNDPRDLSSCKDYEEFFERLKAVLTNSSRSLGRNGRLAVVIGDIRKKGKYISVLKDILDLDGKIGDLRSILIKTQHNVTSSRKSYPGLVDPRIMHEYCVVFRRLNSIKAA